MHGTSSKFGSLLSKLVEAHGNSLIDSNSNSYKIKTNIIVLPANGKSGFSQRKQTWNKSKHPHWSYFFLPKIIQPIFIALILFSFFEDFRSKFFESLFNNRFRTFWTVNKMSLKVNFHSPKKIKLIEMKGKKCPSNRLDIDFCELYSIVRPLWVLLIQRFSNKDTHSFSLRNGWLNVPLQYEPKSLTCQVLLPGNWPLNLENHLSLCATLFFCSFLNDYMQ